MSMKNSNDAVDNRTHDLPAFSTVPQLTGPLHTPKVKSDCALYLRSPLAAIDLCSWSVKMIRLCEVSLVKIMCWLLYNCQNKGSVVTQMFLIGCHNY
jgi:hypothetical protein